MYRSKRYGNWELEVSKSYWKVEVCIALFFTFFITGKTSLCILRIDSIFKKCLVLSDDHKKWQFRSVYMYMYVSDESIYLSATRRKVLCCRVTSQLYLYHVISKFQHDSHQHFGVFLPTGSLLQTKQLWDYVFLSLN